MLVQSAAAVGIQAQAAQVGSHSICTRFFDINVLDWQVAWVPHAKAFWFVVLAEACLNQLLGLLGVSTVHEHFYSSKATGKLILTAHTVIHVDAGLLC